MTIAKRISLRGAGCIRLRVGFVTLTREPDTVSTVGGKDAHMRYHLYRIAPRRLQCDIFYFGQSPEISDFWTADLFSQLCRETNLKYTKYSFVRFFLI